MPEPVYALGGQEISPLDPNYELYKKQNNIITADTLKPQVDLPIAEPVAMPNLAGEMVGGTEQISKSIADYIKLLTPPKTDLQTQMESLLGEVSDLSAVNIGRGREQLTTEQKFKIPELNKQLTDLSAQIQSQLAEYKAIEKEELNIPLLAQQQATGRGITAGGLAPLTAGQLRQAAIRKNMKAADIGLLQAQALGLQGQLTAAQNMANRAVDLKYQDIQSEINAKLAQIEAIGPFLDKQEKTYAEAVKQKLQDELNANNTKIANEKALQNNLLDLMKSYPDANIALTDTAEQANQKIITNSQIYKNKIQDSAKASVVKRATGPTGPIADKQVIREGDVYEENGKFYVMTPDGGRRAATTDEKNQFISGYTPEELEFEKKIVAETNKLAKGGKWGASWNYIKNLYPDIPNETLDEILDKNKYYNN